MSHPLLDGQIFDKFFMIFNCSVVYAVCQPVLDKLLKEAEIPEDQIKTILEKDLGMSEELWQIWQNVPRDSKKVHHLIQHDKIKHYWSYILRDPLPINF